MIRTTISRIKKVCAITFVPHILKGDIRLAPGKFEKYSAVLKSARKSTKSTDQNDDHEEEDYYSPSHVTVVCEECFRQPRQTPDEDLQLLGQDNCVSYSPPLYHATPACRCPDCNKVIAEIFGEEPYPQAELVGGVTQVNMASTEKSTDKTQVTGAAETDIPNNNTNTLKDAKRDVLIKDNQNDAITINKSSFRSVLVHEVVLMKKNVSADNESKVMDTESRRAYSSVFDGDHPTIPTDHKSHTNVEGNDLKVPNTDSTKKDEDNFWSIVYETAIGEHSVYFEPNSTIDLNTLNVYRMLKGKDTSFDDTEAGPKRVKSLDGLDKMLYGNPFEVTILNTTTDKQNDEKLNQRIERIDETPLVEAENSRVDGFNSTPKVLGRINRTPNVADINLDKLAKECLHSSNNQIDEILLREMEKLGIPLTGRKNTHILKDEDVNADIFNKPPRKPKAKPQKEIDLETRENEREPITSNRKSSDNTESTDRQNLTNAEKQFLYDLERTNNRASAEKSSHYESNDTHRGGDHSVEWPSFGSGNENKPKNDKKSTILPIHLGRNNQSGGTTEGESYQTQIWQKDHLDPKHVLTCNETCAINPNPILVNNDLKNPETTPATYDGQFIPDTRRILNETEYREESRTPMLEEGSPAPFNYYYNHHCNMHNQCGFQNLRNSAPASGQEGAVSFNKADSVPSGVPSDRETIIQWTIKPVPQETTQRSKTTELPLANILADARFDFKEPSSSKSLEVTEERLQTTSDRLRATSEKIEATSEQLQATCEQLHFTTKLLQSASQQMLLTSEKLLSMKEIDSMKQSPPATNEPDAKKGEDTKAPDESLKAKSLTPDTKKDTKTDVGMVLDKLSHSGMAISPGPETATMTPAPMIDELASPLVPLPEVNDQTKLSELMRLVRERNRLMNCPQCSKQRPCPPPLVPRHTTPVFTTPGYPEIKPRPRVCVPKKPKPHKPKEMQCSRCDSRVLGLDGHQGPSIYDDTLVFPAVSTDINEHELQGIDVTTEMSPAEHLTEEIMRQLQSLGNYFESTFREVKTGALEAAMLAKSRHRSELFKPKDYEPWTPIPSWPYPKKYERPKLQCPKDGCKVPPPQAGYHLPCGLKPCESFPTFPPRTLSMLDFFTVSIGDHKVVDLGDF